MANTLNEILLDWINTYIRSQYTINPDSYQQFSGDTEEPFVQIQEWVYRKKLTTEYLKEPTEKTIQKFLNTLKEELQDAGNVQKKAINKVLARFKKIII